MLFDGKMEAGCVGSTDWLIISVTRCAFYRNYVRFLRLPLGGATVLKWNLQIILNISSPDGGFCSPEVVSFFSDLEHSW